MILNNMVDIDIIKNLDITQFNQVYSGRQGCACGCGGTYNETERSFKSTVRRLTNKIKSGEELQIMKGFDEWIVSWEGETRAIRIYTKENLNGFVNS
jgi:hypothetical protein